MSIFVVVMFVFEVTMSVSVQLCCVISSMDSFKAERFLVEGLERLILLNWITNAGMHITNKRPDIAKQIVLILTAYSLWNAISLYSAPSDIDVEAKQKIRLKTLFMLQIYLFK